MKLKLFTFRFSESSDGFNDEPLQKFTADKEVVEFTNHFFKASALMDIALYSAENDFRVLGWRAR